MAKRQGRRHWQGCAAWCGLAVMISACLSGAVAGGEAPVAPKADEHTIALLHLDETEGTVARDASAHGYDARFEDAPRDPAWRKDGRFGGCLEFDGTNADENGDGKGDADGLMWEKGATADPKGAGFTVEMWVKHTHVEGWQFYLTNGGGYYFIAKKDKLFVTLKPVEAKRWLEIDSTSCLKPGVWQHVAFTYDKAFVRLYCDGVEVGKMALPGEIAAGSARVIVGHDSDLRPGQIRGMCGLIDEVRISNIARTSFP